MWVWNTQLFFRRPDGTHSEESQYIGEMGRCEPHEIQQREIWIPASGVRTMYQYSCDKRTWSSFWKRSWAGDSNVPLQQKRPTACLRKIIANGSGRSDWSPQLNRMTVAAFGKHHWGSSSPSPHYSSTVREKRLLRTVFSSVLKISKTEQPPLVFKHLCRKTDFLGSDRICHVSVCAHWAPLRRVRLPFL